jgi:hypothetical protein
MLGGCQVKSVRYFIQTATARVLQASRRSPMTLTKDVEVLRNIPLLAKVEPATLKLLAFTIERLQYLSGDELFHQGDYGDAVYPGCSSNLRDNSQLTAVRRACRRSTRFGAMYHRPEGS